MTVQLGKLFENLSALDIGLGLVSSLCVSVIMLSIFLNFMLARANKPEVKREKRSIVATGTMMLFFFSYFQLLRVKVGTVAVPETVHTVLGLIGAGVLILGTIVNVTGRFRLGNNWGNQIRIYKAHRFVNDGIYKYLRHPLYGSLTWMFFAGGMIYNNWAVMAANAFVFIPFMVYRAKQEETLLMEQFKEYKEYREKTGMFFPKIFKRRNKKI